MWFDELWDTVKTNELQEAKREISLSDGAKEGASNLWGRWGCHTGNKVARFGTSIVGTTRIVSRYFPSVVNPQLFLTLSVYQLPLI